jgi:hypothetical protein
MGLWQLNAELREVAAEHEARVADVHGCFLGHGLLAGNPAQGDPQPSNFVGSQCGARGVLGQPPCRLMS